MDVKSPRAELEDIQLRAHATIAAAKAAGREITNAELARLEADRDRAVELKTAIERAEKSAKLMQALGGGVTIPGGPGEPEGFPQSLGGKEGLDLSHAGTKRMASQLAARGIKALVQAGTSGTAVEFEPAPIVAANARPLAGLLGEFNVVQRRGRTYEYLRQSVRTNNAAVVAPGATKPTSIYTVAKVDGELKVYAHLSEPIDKYLLEDNRELEAFLVGELQNGLLAKVETDLLAAIAGASGAQTVTTGGSAADRVHNGIMKSASAGYTPDLVIVSFADYEAMKLSKDAEERYLGAGPFDGGPIPALWGTRTFISSEMTPGTALIVPTTAVGVSTDTQGVVTDVDTLSGFATNQVRFRHEGRFAFDVKQPGGIVVVTLTGA